MAVKGLGKVGADEMWKIFIERLRGDYLKSKKTSLMERGNDIEPECRLALEMKLGVKIELSGFIIDPVTNSGSTPDGIFYLDGDKCLFEGKARGSEWSTEGQIIHYNYAEIIHDKHPDFWQLQHQLYVTGAKYNYYCNFNPDVSEIDRLLDQRVERSEKHIDLMVERLILCNNIIQKVVDEHDHTIDNVLSLSNSKAKLYSLVGIKN
jgi:hypothetical protein